MSTTFLDEADRWLRDHVAPRAAALDTDREALGRAFADLGERGWLALGVPEALGGSGLPAPRYARWQALVARRSGALAFLQTQHQSAGAMIAAGGNAALQRSLLPAMRRGEVAMGIGYGHLRRPGEPLVRVRAVDGGMTFHGTSPGGTGLGRVEQILVGGLHDDGRAFFAAVPLRDAGQGGGGRIGVGPPMQMATMTHTGTVSLRLDGWFVAAEDIARTEPPGWMAERDRRIVARKAFFALGCARAGVDIVEEVARRRGAPHIEEAAAALAGEHRALATQLAALVDTESEGGPEARDGRAHAVELAGRCAHAAVAATSGRANLASDPAQRVYREALLFTVLAQTSDQQRAVLGRLSR